MTEQTDQLRPNRRDLLRASAIGGAALALGAAACSSDAGSGGGGSTTIGTLGTSTGPGSTLPGDSQFPAAMRYFADDGLNFAALLLLGTAGYGNVEVGEALTAFQKADELGSDPQAMVTSFDEWVELTRTRAEEALAADHRVTAADNFRRSAEYGTISLFYALGSDAPSREPEVFATLKASWLEAIGLDDIPIERVEIPYEGTSLPGYLMRPAGATDDPRPTVIVNNGSDGQSVDTYAFGGRAAVDRGYNALLLEGPGQGEMLFERGVPFRPDWEAVITPVVDWLLSRPDVDPDRIALTGWSMGGELVSRAAAFEPRLSALVCDPGATNIWLAFPEELRGISEAGDAATVNKIWAEDVIPGATPMQAYNLKKRLEVFSAEALQQARQGQVPSDWYGLSQLIQQFRCDDVLDRIACPVLVLDYQDDFAYPGQATELYGKLTAPKDLVQMTAVDGTQYHCAPMAPRRRNEIVYDWLADTWR